MEQRAMEAMRLQEALVVIAQGLRAQQLIVDARIAAASADGLALP